MWTNGPYLSATNALVMGPVFVIMSLRFPHAEKSAGLLGEGKSKYLTGVNVMLQALGALLTPPQVTVIKWDVMAGSHTGARG